MTALTLTVLGLSGCDAGSTDDGLQITEARIRALIPGQSKTAGYFTAINRTGDEIVLVGAESEAVDAVDMHTIVKDGDMVRMRPLPKVVIAPGETVRFEPGGHHLMLFGVDELAPFTEIVLVLEDGTRMPVRFETIAIGGG